MDIVSKLVVPHHNILHISRTRNTGESLKSNSLSLGLQLKISELFFYYELTFITIN